MKILVTTLAAAACFTTACTESDSSSSPPVNEQPDVTTVPGSAGSTIGGLRFSLAGPTTPGRAEFAGAYYVSEDQEVSFDGSGFGSMSLTVGDQAFQGAYLNNFFMPMVDELYQEYVGFVGGQVRQTAAGERMDQIFLVVPRSDLLAGGDIALDGERRFAIFVSGDTYLGPDVYAAAISGTATLQASNGHPDEVISASVVGDFGLIELHDGDDEPNPPPFGS